MMQILHKNEYGNGLDYQGGKLQVKAGRNVTVDEGGVHVDFPAPTVDVKIAGLTFENGKLKASLSDNSTVETDFNAQVIVSAIEQADDTTKARIVAALKDQLIEALKGEEVQDFAGNTKGFLIQA